VVIALLVAGMIVGTLAFARHQARIEHRASLVSEARTLRQSRLASSRGAALGMLREAWSIAPSAEIRHEAAACLALPEIGPMRLVTASPPDLTRSADCLLVAAFSGNDIVIRQTATGRETARLPGRKPGTLMRLDDQGSRIAIAEPASGLLQIISLSDQRLLATCPHPMQLHDVAWSGDLIATSCDNRFIYLWDDQGHLKHRLSGHESPVIRLAFRPGGQELASTAADNHVRLWHAARGTEILRLGAAHQAHSALWWSTDGATLFGSTGDGQTEAFPVYPSKCLDLLAPPQDEPHSENLGSADLSADGRFAVVIDEQSARLWDFGQGRLLQQYPKTIGQWLSARFSPDGRELLLCGWADDLTKRPLHANHGARAAVGPPATLLAGHGNLLRDTTSDGTRTVLSNNETGHFLVLFKDGSPLVSIHHPGTLATTISPAGSWLVTTSYLKTGAKVWSLPEGRLIHTLCQGETVMQTCALGNHRLIARTSGSVRVFRTTDWTEEISPPAHLRLNGMTASRDGRLLATLGENDIRILETTGFTECLRLTPPAHAGWLGECHLVFDADASHLLVHTALGAVMRWNLNKLDTELEHFSVSP
jgi:WD40 repeat protein